MFNNEAKKQTNNYIKYNEISGKINIIFSDIENCDFLTQKEIDNIEIKLNQIKTKVLKKS